MVKQQEGCNKRDGLQVSMSGWLDRRERSLEPKCQKFAADGNRLRGIAQPFVTARSSMSDLIHQVTTLLHDGKLN
jgi:hypothetical protein